MGHERTVTDNTQAVAGRVNYDAFGQVVGSTGSSGSSYMYGATSGYRNDWDGGLVHVGARYYDPQVGRFVTPDSFLSENPFLYCEHDPVNRTDPSGHDGISTSVGGVGMFGIGVSLDLSILWGFNGDVGISLSGFGVYGPGAGWSAGPGLGYFSGGVSTGIQNGWTGGAFAGIIGGISISTSGPIGGPATSAGGGAKFGPTVGGGMYSGVGQSMTLKLGNLKSLAAAARGVLSALTFGLL